MIAALLEKMRAGDRNALARLLTLAARGEHGGEMQSLLAGRASDGSSRPSLARPANKARVIAFTGSAGVGKSTLIGKLIPQIRGQNPTIAVLACDPQSPLTGGALLGDRFRMGSSTDDGVFIRSVATVSNRGGVAEHLDVMIGLLEAFGFDVIFLETVGAGQGDVAVRNLADVVVLMLQPESGDDVQWDKAGILECADIVVVHKADLPSADDTAAQVRAALDLSPARHVPVVRVSTKANTGHAELWQAIQAVPSRRQQSSTTQQLRQAAVDWLEERFRAAEARRDPSFTKLVDAWQKGETSTEVAVHSLLANLADS
jgi:LAO/AO transport system ATPase